MPHTANPFDLFWFANRGNFHEQGRALGLLEKDLSKNADDLMTQVCKACLLIQTSQDWEAVDHRQRAISVALDMIRETRPAVSRQTRRRIEFAVGISLAQLPPTVRLDDVSSGILRHLLSSGNLEADFTPSQRLETHVAFSAVCLAEGEAEDASAAFVAAKELGLEQAVAAFEDYQFLRSARDRQED
ncbi:hypothetical protein [Sagittula marina]|nr:hypothetical protein [Sagittula marina]